MQVNNIKELLKSAPMDSGAGIKVVKVTGDELISVFAAEVASGTELTPHYHETGVEIYQVYQGTGIMKVGSLDNEELLWNHVLEVSTGDSFTIQEGEVHQIVNNSSEPLLMLFTCRENHLSSDRFFVK